MNRNIEEDFRLYNEIFSYENSFSSSKYIKILADLKSNDDPKILDAVIQLCTHLSMADETSLLGFNLEHFIPCLIGCLKKELIPDILIHATSCIFHILELFPNAGKLVVQIGGIQLLCEKMQKFEYVDVAENSIKALEKLSYDYGEEILNNGTIPIILNIIDFFYINIQNTMLNVVGNALSSIPNETVLNKNVLNLLPNLNKFLVADASKDEIFSSLYWKLSDRIMRMFEEDFDKKQNYIEIIIDKDLLERIFKIIDLIISDGIPLKKIETLKNFFKILNKLCYYSPKSCFTCFKSKLIVYMDKIFTFSENLTKDSQEFSNLLLESILLINSILSLRSNPHTLISQISPLVGIKILENTKVSEKVELFKANKDFMTSIIEVFYNRVTFLYERNTSLLYKYLILIILEKIIIFSNSQDLIKFSNFSGVSQFLYRLLQSLDIMIIALSLLIIDAFLNKVPNITNDFWREGVFEQIKILKNEKEINRLSLISLTRNQRSNEQKLQGFGNNSISNCKYESVAEKMKNLNNLINKIDKNINDIYQPKLISNIKNTNDKKNDGIPNNNKKNMIGLGSAGSASNKKNEINFDKNNNLDNNDKGNFITEYNTTKMNFIKKDIILLINEIHEKIKNVSVSKNYSDNSEKIHSLLTEITTSFQNFHEKNNDYGLAVFEKMFQFLTKYKKFTNYEIKIHKLIVNINDFLFEGLLNPKTMDVCDEKQEISFSNKEFCEFSRGTESDPFPEIDVNEEQVNKIFKKLFVFTNFLLMKNPSNPQTLIIHNLNETLQEMISSIESESKNLNFFRNLDSFSNLAQDLKFLSQRVRFKVRFNENQEFGNNNKSLFLIKSKSTHIKDKNLNNNIEQNNKNYSKESRDILEFKESLLKEIPLLVLSIEQFGTLEIIEDFLLNKITGKNDFQYGGIFNTIFNKIKKNIGKNEFFQNKNQKKEVFDCELNDDDNENDSKGDEFDESDGENEKEDEENNQRKKPHSFALSKKPQKISKMENPPKELKVSEISMKKKTPEKSSPQGNKKMIFENLSNSNLNFKKYLEVQFFINNIDIPKNVTIYEIIQKFKKTNLVQDDSIVLDYQISIKDVTRESSSIINQSILLKQKYIKSLIFTKKQMMQSLLKKIQNMGSEIVRDENFELFKPILQFFILLIDLCKHYSHYFSSSSPFYPHLKTINFAIKSAFSIEETFKNHIILLETVKFSLFENSRVSKYLIGLYNDPILIASGFIPEFFNVLAMKTLCLISFHTRQEFFKNVNFPVSRALYFIYHSNKDKLKELESLRIGKLRRKKIKTSRDKIIENAISNFESYGAKKHVLEFEFFEEEGSGLGPTLEYFSLVSQEIIKLDKLLWRKAEDGSLFPCPLPSQKFQFLKKQTKENTSFENQNQFDKIQPLFKMMGALIGRAILDERLIDLPINSLFWDLILDRPVYLGDIKKIDKKLGETLLGLQELVIKRKEIEKNENFSLIQINQQIEKITFKGCAIEDLCLDFTFPGQTEILLIEGGSNKQVDIRNLDSYIELCFKFFFVETLRTQIMCFREGLEKVLPLSYFAPILSEEIEQLYCGINLNKKWEKSELLEHVIPAYGYTPTNKTYIDLINILSELNSEEQKMFLKFVTGSPRLPLGGFKNLNPKLTVVKKQPDKFEQNPDEFLPSVMTCQNYLKLPEYSNISIMKDKLKYAIVEGQNSFSLS